MSGELRLTPLAAARTSASGDAGAAAARDRALAEDGWCRRFVGAPPRLEEVVELYRSLGHEVRLESVIEQDLDHDCAGCTLALSLFRIVYTRRA